MRVLTWLLAGLLLALGAFVLGARLGALETDPEEARARYGQPPSQFVEIDGTRVHYRDEGTGPVLVMLHGSRASLHQWDGWVAQLGGRFRIVRLDSAAHGLSLDDPSGDYGTERQQRLLGGLFERLGLERFVLIGTSSGATEALRYAAAHPERVEKLVLSTVPLQLPAVSRASRMDRLIFAFHDKVLGTPSTTLYWSRFLRSIFGDPDGATPELIERHRVLNGQPGREAIFRGRIARWRAEGGAQRDAPLAAQIRMPTLIQWGGAGPVLPRELHCEIAAKFTGTRVQVISYPELGHQLVVEDPVRTAADALAFIVEGRGGEPCAPEPTARSDASVAASSR